MARLRKPILPTSLTNNKTLYLTASSADNNRTVQLYLKQDFAWQLGW